MPKPNSFPNTQVLLALFVLLGISCLPAQASDPVGIYALVDKVVLEPNEKAPERIQIWGAFALAKGSGYAYDRAQSGFLYFKVKPGEEAVCRKEWADFKTVAGTRQCVGFGSRYGEKGRLRKASDKTENPDLYPVAWGITKVRDTEYQPIKDLLSLAPVEKSKKQNADPGGAKSDAGSKRSPEKEKK